MRDPVTIATFPSLLVWGRNLENAARSMPAVAMPAKVVQLFYNPGSGSFSPAALDELATALRDEGGEVILTPSMDQAPSIDPRASHICIAGGDGTIRHVAAKLIESACSLPVAIYPLGTINLIARESFSGRTARNMAKDLLQNTTSHGHHPVRFGNSAFFACASVGPDSFVVSRVSPKLKSLIGRAAYFVAILKMLVHWPRHKLIIRGDAASFTCEAVYVAKGRYYAGPWSFAPNARVTDKLLHVVALRQTRRRDYLRFALAVLSDRDVANHSNTIAFTCSQLSIEGDPSLPVQADGDIIATCPIELQIGDRPIHFY